MTGGGTCTRGLSTSPLSRRDLNPAPGYKGVEQPARRRCDLVHGVVEGALVGAGGDAVTADFAHELKRSRAYFLVVCNSIGITQGLDAPAHDGQLTRNCDPPLRCA